MDSPSEGVLPFILAFELLIKAAPSNVDRPLVFCSWPGPSALLLRDRLVLKSQGMPLCRRGSYLECMGPRCGRSQLLCSIISSIEASRLAASVGWFCLLLATFALFLLNDKAILQPGRRSTIIFEESLLFLPDCFKALSVRLPLFSLSSLSVHVILCLEINMHKCQSVLLGSWWLIFVEAGQRGLLLLIAGCEQGAAP